MRAFIVRPFGARPWTAPDGTAVRFDFDDMHARLIAPALAACGVTGDTTAEFVHAGGIREDMFQMLAGADLVIADVSLHNANVFYELGIRHALRPCATVLIRWSADAVPFDVQAERYLSYDRRAPEMALPTLIAAIEAARKRGVVDSPVFRLLPDLVPQDPRLLIVPPPSFREAVTAARSDPARLGLLAEDAAGEPWESGGWRRVARLQFKLGLWQEARRTWERVRAHLPNDVDANADLATVFQRLGLTTESEAALERVLSNPLAGARARSEARTQLSRNHKREWLAAWQDAAPDDRFRLAAECPLLHAALKESWSAFLEDPSYHYPAVNALALAGAALALSEARWEDWWPSFETEERARGEQQRIRALYTRVAHALPVTFDAERLRLERLGMHDEWLDFSQADHCLLTTASPGVARAAYRKAVDGVERKSQRASPFAVEAAAAQLGWLAEVGVATENIAAALQVLGPPPRHAPVTRPDTVVLFSGHMLDLPDRATPRFPAEKVPAVRAWIAERLARLAPDAARSVGVAGAARGGDLLFLEEARRLGLRTDVLLAVPAPVYRRLSVEGAGREWGDRFDSLVPPDARVLQRTEEEKPAWVSRGGWGLWSRNTWWMLHHALGLHGRRTVLVSIWNGREGDGPGGTREMVEAAKRMGVQVEVADPLEL